jgi:hypothetical protein
VAFPPEVPSSIGRVCLDLVSTPPPGLPLAALFCAIPDVPNNKVQIITDNTAVGKWRLMTRPPS